jgi:hypothetical protein
MDAYNKKKNYAKYVLEMHKPKTMKKAEPLIPHVKATNRSKASVYSSA